MTINLYMNPYREEDFPRSGGVCTHLTQFKKHIATLEEINLLPFHAMHQADVQHIEATYMPVMHDKPMVYVCHGGFKPTISPIVTRNLYKADFIISVADWLSMQFFPQLQYKTATIPNGVDLAEFDDLPPSGLEPGYILYGKEWRYYFEDFVNIALGMPKQRFVTVYWPEDVELPSNVRYIGRQSPDTMKAIIKDAAMLLITGSEVCPIMLLEAWAAGTPVLARAIDGNVEIMRPFYPDSEEVIGGVLYTMVPHAIRSIPRIKEMRDVMGRQGRARVEEMYQWKNLIPRYLAAYHCVIEVNH